MIYTQVLNRGPAAVRSPMTPGRGGLMRTPGRPRRYYIFMQTSICRRITTLSASNFRASAAIQASYVTVALAVIRNMTDRRCSE